jgi:hypothetical protein
VTGSHFRSQIDVCADRSGPGIEAYFDLSPLRAVATPRQTLHFDAELLFRQAGAGSSDESSGNRILDGERFSYNHQGQVDRSAGR